MINNLNDSSSGARLFRILTLGNLLQLARMEQYLPNPNGIKPVTRKLLSEFYSKGKLAEKYSFYIKKNSTCPICADKIGEGKKIIALPCGHLFHSSCIATYLDMNTKCPICRIDIDEASKI